MENQELSCITQPQFPENANVDTVQNEKQCIAKNTELFLRLCDKALFEKTWKYPSDSVKMNTMFLYLQDSCFIPGYSIDVHSVVKTLSDRGWVVAVESIKFIPYAITIYHPRQVGIIRRFFCLLTRAI